MTLPVIDPCDAVLQHSDAGYQEILVRISIDIKLNASDHRHARSQDKQGTFQPATVADLNCVAARCGPLQREIRTIVAVQVGEGPRPVKCGFLAAGEECWKSRGENPVGRKEQCSKQEK